MNAKHTWIWLLVATVLFAFIFFVERHWRRPVVGPQPVLPGLKAGEVTSVQVYPAGRFEIRAERTNGGWLLTKPIVYPAQAARIEALLETLERLVPAAPPLTAHQLRRRPQADAEFGLENPQVLLAVQQEKFTKQIRIGSLTSPGDQVFLRVEGAPDIFVVEAGLLTLIPRATNDWRDIAVLNLRALDFDRLVFTSGDNVIEFHRDANPPVWRMARPMRARADNARLEETLQALQLLSVSQFVTDDPGADLEAYGLQPAGWEVALFSGTNPVARLSLGGTNDAGHIYARRPPLPGVVTLPPEIPARLRAATYNDYRDRHLLSLPPALGPIEVRGEDRFTLLPRTNYWQLLPAEFPVDNRWADDFVASLIAFEVGFHQNAATEADLRANGLLPPTREIILRKPASPDGTNGELAQFSFGVTNDSKVMVARADEDTIYALRLADFEQLPWAARQLRDRRIWQFSENDVARVVIRQAGKSREIVRRGTNAWALAPGSEGIINSFAVEETTHRIGELEATFWVERGAKDPVRYGLTTNSLALTFELKTGEQRAVSLGSFSPAQYPYALVTLDGEPWVFEFPLALYHYVRTYLTVESNTP